jgi:hypothetical protein
MPIELLLSRPLHWRRVVRKLDFFVLEPLEEEASFLDQLLVDSLEFVLDILKVPLCGRISLLGSGDDVLLGLVAPLLLLRRPVPLVDLLAPDERDHLLEVAALFELEDLLARILVLLLLILRTFYPK